MNRYMVVSFVSIFLIIVFVFIGIDNLSFSTGDVVFGVVILLVNGFFIDYLSRRQNRIICNKCGYKNSKRHKQCLNCGNDIEDIVCPVCKGLNKYNQKYCSECQTKLLERSEIV